MLAALFMYERIDDARWRDLFLRSFQPLWDQWKYTDEARCHLWTSSLYGVTEMRLGAIHGFARQRVCDASWTSLVRAESCRRNVAANPRDGSRNCFDRRIARKLAEQRRTRRRGRHRWRLSCNTAMALPGLSIVWRSFRMMRAGPSTRCCCRQTISIWEAGPPVKFPSLCHGAAGSGYAFLKLYVRTGDGRWLDRARRFAMHAIDQCDSAAQKIRPAEVFAMDRRPGPRDLSVGLHRRDREIPDARCFLIAAVM